MLEMTNHFARKSQAQGNSKAIPYGCGYFVPANTP